MAKHRHSDTTVQTQRAADKLAHAGFKVQCAGVGAEGRIYRSAEKRGFRGEALSGRKCRRPSESP